MPQPNKIPLPFAASGDKNTIPESTETTGLASWREGFPAITSAPFSEGGIAPKRADFNGIFNALSAATVWQQQGGVYAYDNTTDYEVGNVVLYSGNLYKCITANGPGSAVKVPTDTTVWDAIATASGYLPLSGGTMTGTLNTQDIYIVSGAIRSKTDNSEVDFYGGAGWARGAQITVRGKDHATAPGEWSMRADNGNNSCTLFGKPDGTLTWNGDTVLTTANGLPLSGGAMTGDITTKNILLNNGIILNTVDNSETDIFGGNNASNGARILLYGKNEGSYPGQFYITAKDGTYTKHLNGKPDGTLTWDGKDVATIQTGTWTPVLKGSTVAGAFTYNVQRGYYLKIGPMVYLFARLNTSAYTTHPTGDALISGLPYTPDFKQGGMRYEGDSYATGGANLCFRRISGAVIVASTGINLEMNHLESSAKYFKASFNATAASSGTVLTFDSSNNSCDIYLSIWYQTAS